MLHLCGMYISCIVNLYDGYELHMYGCGTNFFPDVSLTHSEKCLVDSSIEYGYYTDNQIFGWAHKIFWLIKFGWLYQLFWLIQPNTMVNLKKRFCSSK